MNSKQLTINTLRTTLVLFLLSIGIYAQDGGFYNHLSELLSNSQKTRLLTTPAISQYPTPTEMFLRTKEYVRM